MSILTQCRDFSLAASGLSHEQHHHVAYPRHHDCSGTCFASSWTGGRPKQQFLPPCRYVSSHSVYHADPPLLIFSQYVARGIEQEKRGVNPLVLIVANLKFWIFQSRLLWRDLTPAKTLFQPVVELKSFFIKSGLIASRPSTCEVTKSVIQRDETI